MPVDRFSPDVASQALRLGREIRARREALGVSAIATAEASHISRVTLHRIERGQASVSMAAYLRVLSALGLDCKLVEYQQPKSLAETQLSIPVEVSLAAYPTLKSLAWQVQGVDALTPQEAWDIYDRNWRHADLESIQPDELALIEALRRVFGRGPRNV